jgi:hypothetical protein
MLVTAARTAWLHAHPALDDHHNRMRLIPSRQLQLQLRALLHSERLDQTQQLPELMYLHLHRQCPPPKRALTRVWGRPWLGA